MKITTKALVLSVNDPYNWDFNGKTGTAYSATLLIDNSQYEVKVENKDIYSLLKNLSELEDISERYIEATLDIKALNGRLLPKAIITAVE